MSEPLPCSRISIMACDRLTPLDATFLELEEADEAAHMHIGVVMVFEGGPGLPPTLAALRRHLDERIDALPRYRCGLSETHTGGLRWPAWDPDPTFDIAEHVGHAQLPAPGGQKELLEWAAGYWSERLDRRRPLWDAQLVTGLEDGRWALGTKTHHALVDGVGALDVAHILLDTSRKPTGRLPMQAEPSTSAGRGELLTGAIRGSLYAARHPGRLRDAFLQSKAMAELIVRDEVLPAPRCSLNAPISPVRSYRGLRAELSRLKQIKRELGGTVNDVVLAAVTGGLRSLLIERGDEVGAPGLRAMVPVNTRTAVQHFGLGNRISSLFVHLPVMEPNPLRRYQLIAGETAQLKSGDMAGGAAELVAISGLAPPILHSVLARSLFATRLFNITVTNVPGPQIPLFAFGARLEEAWPLVPLAADHPLGIAVMSYDGQVFFGVCADDSFGEELDLVSTGIASALMELGASNRAVGVS
jgi:diacylglycerol O-acyltransferase / wax synthase